MSSGFDDMMAAASETAQLQGEIDSALRSLGRTPEEIASTLSSAGALGVRNEPDSCPVAVWLNDVLREGDVDEVRVDRRDVVVSADGVRLRMDAPDTVAAFVGRFDDGEFTELERVTQNQTLRMSGNSGFYVDTTDEYDSGEEDYDQ